MPIARVVAGRLRRVFFSVALGLSSALTFAADGETNAVYENFALPREVSFTRMLVDAPQQSASASVDATTKIKALFGNDPSSAFMVGHTAQGLSRVNQMLPETHARNVTNFSEKEQIPHADTQIVNAMKIPGDVVEFTQVEKVSPVIMAMRYAQYLIVVLVGVYTLRHYLFTLNRLFGRQRHPYTDVDCAEWPSITVLIAAHNEEAVVAGVLEAILDMDYPQDRLRIMPVNDRSSDRTEEIIESVCSRYAGRITPFHRRGGKPGKAAALKDAMAFVDSAIIIIFDADHIPSRGLLKQLAAPFFDPQVGAVMGRVVPWNAGSNLLTRLLDLERAGGYQVNQQARMNLDLVPQYGGTVGGVRVAALNDVGGWHDDVLAEDTDLTFRLLLNNWKTVYQNRSECYEEVPETWPVRIKQIQRWAKGHNQAMFRYAIPLLRHSRLRLSLRFDGLLLLGTYAMAPLLALGWGLSLALFFLEARPAANWIVALFALMSFSALGNFAAFFEIAAAVYLDGNRQRARLLPLNCLGFLISVLSVTRATVDQIVLDPIFKRSFHWDKTPRYRQAPLP